MIYLGYRFELTPGKISGAEYLSYSKEPWDIPTIFYNKVEPDITIAPPLGYLIPQQWSEVIEILKLHGAKIHKLAEDLKAEFECWGCIKSLTIK